MFATYHLFHTNSVGTMTDFLDIIKRPIFI
jgi:hypothetical protein